MRAMRAAAHPDALQRGDWMCCSVRDRSGRNRHSSKAFVVVGAGLGRTL